MTIFKTAKNPLLFITRRVIKAPRFSKIFIFAVLPISLLHGYSFGNGFSEPRQEKP